MHVNMFYGVLHKLTGQIEEHPSVRERNTNKRLLFVSNEFIRATSGTPKKQIGLL